MQTCDLRLETGQCKICKESTLNFEENAALFVQLKFKIFSLSRIVLKIQICKIEGSCKVFELGK